MANIIAKEHYMSAEEPTSDNSEQKSPYPKASKSGSSHRTRSKKWRVVWVGLILLLLISTAAGIVLVPGLYRINNVLKSVTSQALPHVKTSEKAIDIPTPISLPDDLARLNHLNLLLLASKSSCWLSNRSWTRGTFLCILKRSPLMYRGVC
jgi:hypothetical protein